MEIFSGMDSNRSWIAPRSLPQPMRKFRSEFSTSSRKAISFEFFEANLSVPLSPRISIQAMRWCKGEKKRGDQIREKGEGRCRQATPPYFFNLKTSGIAGVS